ncbi:type II toxin-antitoxin system RelB/DinJ family antitoxin [Rickettsia endosymbiont of Halotydeus destructor]|uniref:type II toxin-antitoxin system RelB/DinJ family antitoxin n=1 Tax=Rickettsia endosymbiont of Halotydeus destructor TaxID=2996754 RepID=UPI003BAFCA42
MTKSAFIRARVEPELKEEAENVLDELGITPTQAVTMLYKYVAREHKWPTTIKIPNTTTLKTFKSTDNKIGLITSKNTKEMFKKLGI